MVGTSPTKQAAIVTVLLGLSAVGPLLGGGVFLGQADNLNLLMAGAQTWFLLVFSILGGILVGCAVLPSFLLAGYLGYCAGFAGYIYTALAMMVALAMGLAIFRQFSQNFFEKILAAKPRWQKEFLLLQHSEEKNISRLIFLGRLSPHAPFAATNLILSQLNLNMRQVFWSSWLGMLPRSFLAVFLGQGLAEIANLQSMAESVKWTGVATLIFGIASAIWLIRYSLRRTAHKETPQHDSALECSTRLEGTIEKG